MVGDTSGNAHARCGANCCEHDPTSVLIAGLDISPQSAPSAQPWDAVAGRKSRRKHDEVPETQALIGHSPSKIALHISQSCCRPTLDALVKRHLGAAAVEVADDA